MFIFIARSKSVQPNQRIFRQISTFLSIAALLSVSFATITVTASPAQQTTLNLTQYVNPFIGTDDSNVPNPVPGGAGGSTYPGAVVPFGMVQFSPDTPSASPSGYRYADTTIQQFSLTHFNGAGCPNNEDLPILPVTGSLASSPGTNWNSYSSGYTKSNEAASPGYYKTRLDKYSTNVELSATTRTGMAKFTYPATTSARVLIYTGLSATGTRGGTLSISGSQLTGSVSAGGFCGSSKNYKIYFAIQFDRTPTGFGTWLGGTLSAGSSSVNGTQSGGYVTFDTTSNTVVQMKVGLSFVSIANAQQNLSTENSAWNFATVQSNANAAWNNILNRVQVTGGTSTNLQKFYTALYHVLMNPNVASDVNGQYMGFDNAVHTATGMGAVYQNYSGWDIYRSWAALVAMIAPNEMNDIAQSMVLDGEQGGELPKWSQETNEDFVMTGDPGPIIVSSAYAFGARGFNTASALNLMNKSGSVVGASTQGGQIRGNLNNYLNLHYVPNDASDSLEYSASDFAIAQFAKALGDTAKYNYFISHAQWWMNVFNTESSYIHYRNSDGSWPWPLDPASNATGYTEGNAAQYTWMVTYNYQSLFDLMGGKPTAVQRLDHLFTQVNAGLTQPYFYIGNEPEHNQPWAYNFAGAPWGAQAAVRRVMNEVFTTGPGGLPGNDDLGATSAWYVWAALGMYPVTPGADTLALHGPLFTSETIQLAGGKVLQVNGAGASDTAQYIQSLTVNGAATTKTYVTYSQIANGATLNFTMGSTPNKSWGINASDAPPSFFDGFTPPPAAPDLGPNLALGKLTTSSAACAAAESSDKAVDGLLMNNSKWCGNVSPMWLQVDLGSNQTVSSFVIKHAGLGGENTGWNTGAYNIQVSADASNWSTVVNVSGVRSSRSYHAISAQPARYIRLNVTTPTNNGNNAARIYELEVYGSSGSTNLALGKPGNASGTCAASETPDKAFDGSVTNNSKWCGFVTNGSAWLSVDLGAVYSINSFIVKHAGAGGESTSWNTKDFQIQYSADGSTNWTALVNVTENTQSITTHNITAQNARYLRLYITNAGADTAARIYEFEVYGKPAISNNLALNKAANANSTCASTETPAKAVDGSITNNSKWCGVVTNGSAWVTVDLGATYSINSFVVKHAGAGGESTSWNTKDFQIQYSPDGTTLWTTLVNVTGNTQSITTHNITAQNARYLRLYITNAGADTAARIYEFEVYGTGPVSAMSANTVQTGPTFMPPTNTPVAP